jgi:hypothetical protein
MSVGIYYSRFIFLNGIPVTPTSLDMALEMRKTWKLALLPHLAHLHDVMQRAKHSILRALFIGKKFLSLSNSTGKVRFLFLGESKLLPLTAEKGQ